MSRIISTMYLMKRNGQRPHMKDGLPWKGRRGNNDKYINEERHHHGRLWRARKGDGKKAGKRWLCGCSALRRPTSPGASSSSRTQGRGRTSDRRASGCGKRSCRGASLQGID